MAVRSIARNEGPSRQVVIRREECPPTKQRLPIASFLRLPLSKHGAVSDSVPTYAVRRLPIFSRARRRGQVAL